VRAVVASLYAAEQLRFFGVELLRRDQAGFSEGAELFDLVERIAAVVRVVVATWQVAEAVAQIFVTLTERTAPRTAGGRSVGPGEPTTCRIAQAAPGTGTSTPGRRAGGETLRSRRYGY
jgi:hypothetical protein